MSSDHLTVKMRRRPQVILFPFPYQGHINPMLELASVLHSRGFSITVHHTQFNSIDSTKHPSYDFVSVTDGITSNQFDLGSIVDQIIALNDRCEEPFYDALKKLISDDDNYNGVKCLVADIHWYRIHAAAKRLGVATLVLRTGSAASLRWFTSLPVLLAKRYYPLQESKKNELVGELPPYRVKDLMSISIDKNKLADLATIITQDLEAARNSSGIIINTFSAIESDSIEKIHRDLSVPVFAIGPLHKFITSHSHSRSSLLFQDRSCLDWLDTHASDSVLYVSFGSLASMKYEEFVEIAWGLADSGFPFLWVIRPGSVCGTKNINILTPAGFEEKVKGRGKVLTWAPQLEVLAHDSVGGFWTHNGWNSTVEGICEGVPMICTPHFADQMGNARYVTHVWKVGIELEELERARIARTVGRFMMRGKLEGDGIRERMRELRRSASDCVEADGSSQLAIDKLVDRILSF